MPDEIKCYAGMLSLANKIIFIVFGCFDSKEASHLVLICAVRAVRPDELVENFAQCQELTTSYFCLLR